MPLSEQALANRKRYNREYDKKHPHRKNDRRAMNLDRERKRANDYCNTITGRANRIFQGAKRRAKEKDFEFTITLDDVKRLLEPGLCERTGIRFEYRSEHNLYAPSIDRKDNSRGYSIDNVQMVCCAYNMGKKNMTDDNFEHFILQAAMFIMRRAIEKQS